MRPKTCTWREVTGAIAPEDLVYYLADAQREDVRVAIAIEVAQHERTGRLGIGEGRGGTLGEVAVPSAKHHMQGLSVARGIRNIVNKIDVAIVVHVRSHDTSGLARKRKLDIDDESTLPIVQE